MKYSPWTIYNQSKDSMSQLNIIQFLSKNIMPHKINCSDINNKARFLLLLCYLHQNCSENNSLTSNMSLTDKDTIQKIYSSKTMSENIEKALDYYQNNHLIQNYEFTRILTGRKPNISQPLKNAFDAIDFLRQSNRNQTDGTNKEKSESIDSFCNAVTQDLTEKANKIHQARHNQQQSTCHEIIKTSMTRNANRCFTHRHRKARSFVLSFCFAVLTLGLGPVIRKLSGAQSWTPRHARTTRHKQTQRFFSKQLFHTNRANNPDHTHYLRTRP